MTQLLRWTRRLLATLAVLILIAWMWAWGAQWVLRWRAERLLADIRTLEVGRSTGADVQQFARSRPEWERSQCKGEECVYYSAHIVVFSPYLAAGRLLSYLSSDSHIVEERFGAAMGYLGLRPMFADGYLLVEHESLSMREFMVLLPLPHDPHTVRSMEIAQFKEGSIPREGRHPVVHWMRGTARGIRVEYQPTEDAAIKAGLMDFRLSCITRLAPCASDADVLPAARQMIVDEEKRSGPND